MKVIVAAATNRYKYNIQSYVFTFTYYSQYLQETERYENPHKAYTYNIRSIESTVGPVKVCIYVL